MQTEQLATLLKAACEQAPHGERVATMHLFGIQYADELKGRFHEVAELSGIGRSFGAELGKGAKLAPYVSLKD